MSNEIREKALAAATGIYQGTGSGADALKAAEGFVSFLSGPQPAPSTPASAPRKPGRPRQTEEEVANQAIADAADAAEAEAGEEQQSEDDEPAPDPKKAVQDSIATLLSKNKRKEAVALLKKFGAASATGVKPKDTAKFLAAAKALLGTDDGDGDDLTA